MACDICCRAGVRVESLLPDYATREIGSVCGECSDSIDAKNRTLMADMLKLKADRIKAFVLERRETKRQARQAALEREAADARRR